ncbi:spore coat protein YlbD [Virgibacillus dokdonensis]|uniref:Spore coat protein YlbD n=1 Tax=Virgibacillus dokdonensis TaxID=302167 RepID=A0ABU7VD92_9BACI|nr:spore coat protein YlbD [Virgibacillus dokdonensis]
MSDQDLHPSVSAFKQFINKHPQLIKEVRKSGKPWQDIYEKWVLLGDDDPYWDKFKQADEDNIENKSKDNQSNENNKELFSQLLKMTESMDLEKVQRQMEQFSSSISTIQEIISQFKQTKDTKQPTNERMGWFRD